MKIFCYLSAALLLIAEKPTSTNAIKLKYEQHSYVFNLMSPQAEDVLSGMTADV